MAILATRAVEKSTYVVTVAFTDEAGDPVVPDSIAWTLSDVDGNIINSRDSVAVAIPLASVDIVLSGDDLAIGRANRLERVVTIEAVYDSAVGSNLPFKDEIHFHILELVNVT